MPSRWRSKHRPCPGNPSRTAMSPRFQRLTFTSVIINSLEATLSVDRATERGEAEVSQAVAMSDAGIQAMFFGIMLNDPMTAFLVAFAAVTASGLLSRSWEYV